MHDLARLAAKARVLEAISAGDARVLATEIREAIEAIAGRPVGDVVPISRAIARGKRNR